MKLLSQFRFENECNNFFNEYIIVQQLLYISFNFQTFIFQQYSFKILQQHMHSIFNVVVFVTFDV